MEWVRGMGNGNGGLRGMDSRPVSLQGPPPAAAAPPQGQVGAAFVFVCRRPVLGIGVNFDFLDFLDFCQVPAVPTGSPERPS